MSGTADAAGGHIDRLLLRQCNQLRERFGRNAVVEDDHVRHVAGQCNRRKILERIVAELGLHERIDGERPVRADEQRVAVGRRARHHLRADAAAGAAAVLHHHRLADRLRNLVADHAADNVGIASGREWHNQMDRPLRIGGEGPAWQHCCCRTEAERGDQRAARDRHGGPPGGFRNDRRWSAGIFWEISESVAVANSWRARDDSNVRPLPSEGNALSS